MYRGNSEVNRIDKPNEKKIIKFPTKSNWPRDRT